MLLRADNVTSYVYSPPRMHFAWWSTLAVRRPRVRRATRRRPRADGPRRSSWMPGDTTRSTIVSVLTLSASSCPREPARAYAPISFPFQLEKTGFPPPPSFLRDPQIRLPRVEAYQHVSQVPESIQPCPVLLDPDQRGSARRFGSGRVHVGTCEVHVGCRGIALIRFDTDDRGVGECRRSTVLDGPQDHTGLQVGAFGEGDKQSVCHANEC